VASIIFEYLLTKKNSQLIRKGHINITKKISVTSLHLLVVFLLYLNMFGLMTYNMNIILSIIFGNVVGFMLFGMADKNKIRKIENVGCCHSG